MATLLTYFPLLYLENDLDSIRGTLEFTMVVNVVPHLTP